jgi:catechol 2,3-dioxygenase-like lactoylglutathione lyase family enzyme
VESLVLDLIDCAGKIAFLWMFADTPDFNAWFPEPDGLPRPDWPAIGQFIRTHATEDHWDAAWQEIARVWLEKTSDSLGQSYQVEDSENFHLLSELDEKGRGQLLNFLEGARSRILRTLADIPLPKRYGKHAVVRFTEEDDYYRYIAFYDPDGSWAGSSGVFIRGNGYMHIAYPHHDQPGTDWQILAHELTHNLLWKFRLPPWLNEALAMLFEKDIAGARRILLNRELANQHRVYWNTKTIQGFWSGRSFHAPDGQELSYALARILLDFIVTDIRPAPADFRDFVLHADRKDAGEAAARDYLGVELSDLVSAFLGPGEWAPHFSGVEVREAEVQSRTWLTSLSGLEFLLDEAGEDL